MPVLEGRDGVHGVVPDGPEASAWWACPRPSSDPQHNVPYCEPGDCSWHETPLVPIGPDDSEVLG